MATTNHGGHELPDTSLGHDPSEVDISVVNRVGLLSLAVVAVSMAAMWPTMQFLMGLESAKDTTPLPVAVQGERQPPGPRLQTTEPVDLAAYRSEKESKLTTFGWVDKAAGTVHLPVQYAKDLVLKRGFPPRDPAALLAAQQAQATQGTAPAAPAPKPAPGR